jgi:hypothetical protein
MNGHDGSVGATIDKNGIALRRGCGANEPSQPFEVARVVAFDLPAPSRRAISPVDRFPLDHGKRKLRDAAVCVPACVPGTRPEDKVLANVRMVSLVRAITALWHRNLDPKLPRTADHSVGTERR